MSALSGVCFVCQGLGQTVQGVVIFRFGDCPCLLREVAIKIDMDKMNMMKLYARSFNDKEFMLTLVLDGIDKGGAQSGTI